VYRRCLFAKQLLDIVPFPLIREFKRLPQSQNLWREGGALLHWTGEGQGHLSAPLGAAQR
jgi:hypothetical protein